MKDDINENNYNDYYDNKLKQIKIRKIKNNFILNVIIDIFGCVINYFIGKSVILNIETMNIIDNYNFLYFLLKIIIVLIFITILVFSYRKYKKDIIKIK